MARGFCSRPIASINSRLRPTRYSCFPKANRVDREGMKAAKGTFANMISDALQTYFQPGGPLFFFKVRKEELKARYRLDLMPEIQGRYHLLLAPKTDGDKAEFSHLRVLLDKETLLPHAVKFWSPDGKNTKLFTFTKTAINPEIADDEFKPQIPEGWTVTDMADKKPPG